MISILKVESDFKQTAVSHTGDYSVAQINFKIWAKKFRGLAREWEEDKNLGLIKNKDTVKVVLTELEEASLIKVDLEQKKLKII